MDDHPRPPTPHSSTPEEPGGPAQSPAQQLRLLADVREAYRAQDPVPPGLVPRLQAALAMASSDVDAELMLLVERTGELAGVRGSVAYTLRFQHEQTEMMLRISAENAEARIDGWVVPAEPMSVTALGEDVALGGGPTLVSGTGRFELPGLPVGLVRLRLEPHDTARPAFVTPAFEI